MKLKTSLKVIASLVFCSLILVSSSEALAKKSSYLYRNRANWVKLVRLSNKQLAGQTLSHPYTNVNVDQMVSIMSSLQMNKGQIFKKGFKTSEVFSVAEARKYAPLLVRALNEAEPNQVVNMAIVHRRPFFVVRNDYISVLNVYATDEGVHFYFAKLMARLSGDYQQASKLTESIRDAKSIRVSLEAGEGQMLSPNGNEIISKPENVRLAAFDTQESEEDANEPAIDSGSAKNKKVKLAQKNKANVSSASVALEQSSSAQGDAMSRLKLLEQLKSQKLISDTEYKQKRAQILQSL